MEAKKESKISSLLAPKEGLILRLEKRMGRFSRALAFHSLYYLGIYPGGKMGTTRWNDSFRHVREGEGGYSHTLPIRVWPPNGVVILKLLI